MGLNDPPPRGRLTGDPAGVPRHRVGDVVLLGSRDDDPCPRTVQEADPQDAVAAGPAGRQDGLIPMDFHLRVRQRGQVAIVEHLDFYLHLCEETKRERGLVVFTQIRHTISP